MPQPITTYGLQVLDAVEKRVAACKHNPYLVVRYDADFESDTYWCKHPKGVRIEITRRGDEYLVRYTVKQGSKKFDHKILVTAETIRFNGHLVWIQKFFKWLEERHDSLENQHFLMMEAREL